MFGKHKFEDCDVTSRLYLAIAYAKLDSPETTKIIIRELEDLILPRMKLFLTHHTSRVAQTLLVAMQLAELSESVSEKEISLHVWTDRTNLIRKRFETYQVVMDARLPFLTGDDHTRAVILLLKRAFKEKRWSCFLSIIKNSFSKERPVEVSLLFTRHFHKRGLSEDAWRILSDVHPVTDRMAARVHFYQGLWGPPDYILDKLKIRASMDSQCSRPQRALARFYTKLFEDDRADIGVGMDAITAFVECIPLRQTSCFHDLIRMTQVLFGQVFDDCQFRFLIELFERYDASFLLDVVPQLAAQFVVSNQPTQAFVSRLFECLLPVHFHVLLFPLMRIQSPSTIAIVNDFESKFPRPATEACKFELG